MLWELQKVHTLTESNEGYYLLFITRGECSSLLLWLVITIILNHTREENVVLLPSSAESVVQAFLKEKKEKRQQSYNVLAHHCAECSFFPFLKREHLKRWHLEHLVKICFCTEKNFLSGNALSKWLFIRDMEASSHGCHDDSNWKWRSGTPQRSRLEAPKEHPTWSRAHHYPEGSGYWHCPRVTRSPWDPRQSCRL